MQVHGACTIHIGVTCSDQLTGRWFMAGSSCISHRLQVKRNKRVQYTPVYIVVALFISTQDPPAWTALLVAERKRTCSFGLRLERDGNAFSILVQGTGREEPQRPF